MESIFEEIDGYAQLIPRRLAFNVFLGDSNSLILPTDDLLQILGRLYSAFPRIQGVSSYGSGRVASQKSLGDLIRLREAGLGLIYVGLETGDDGLLKFMQKGATSEQMAAGGRKIMYAGIDLSMYVITGLGGRERWLQHAYGTARVLNEVNPTYIRFRNLGVDENTPLAGLVRDGEFTVTSPLERAIEQRFLVDMLDANVTSRIESNHFANYIDLKGKMPEDRERLLAKLDDFIMRCEEDPDWEREIEEEMDEARKDGML